MEAVILAGGYGTRLRPLTYTRAKSLLPIMNKPMIVHLLESLPKEVDTVILAVNYKKNQIENYFKKHDFGKKIIINDEPVPLGTGGATKFAEDHITDRFFVLNSDIICSVNLSEMIRFHEKNDSKTTISLWPVENVSEFGVADVDKKGKITGFVEKPRPEDAPSNFINAGAYLIEPEILDYIETGKLVSMEKEIFPQIINDTDRFFGYKFKGYWMDIGRISSFIEVHRFLLKQKNLQNFIPKNSRIDGELIESIVGENVKIGKNTTLESTIVFDNVEIFDNVKIKYSVVGENGLIKSNSDIKDSVIGDNEILEERSLLNNKVVWTQKKPDGYPDKQIGNPIESR